MTSNLTQEAAFVYPQDVEVIGNEVISTHLLIDSSSAGGALSALEVRMSIGADGAAPHFHTLSSELFYVIEGEVQIMAGDRIVTVGAGGSVVVPKLMPHAFGASPDSSARLLITLTPGVERFEYFRLLGRIQSGEATLADLAASQDRFDNHFVNAPEWWSERTAGRR